MPKYFYESLSIMVGIMILLLGQVYVISMLPLLVPIINVIGGLIAVLPPSLIFYSKYRAKRDMESQFLVFIRELTDSINTGMTLPVALEYCAKRKYLSLSKYVNDMASQVNWGIPFETALKTFAKRVDIPTVSRAVTTIIETYKVGGKISDTLNAVGQSLVAIDKIKQERTASVHAQIVTSYLIFFVFIFILIVLQTFLIPALVQPSQTGADTFPGGTPMATESYTASFINFIIIQGFFAGLVTGKMAEGSVVAGIKHSILLIAVGYTIFSFTSQFPMRIF
ncbi:MAG: type II secretion system F family protein [Candidatus Aenigmarchaeota archaeon]